MIKANELRVGNLIYYKGEIVSVVPQLIFHLFYTQDETSEHLPIPLSEEILLAAGFEKDSISRWYCLFTDAMLIYATLKGEFRIGSNQIATQTKYLHQLQNLYYNLTGTELTINLTASTT